MATSDNELSDNEWRDKYEQLVQVLQNEFQETVLKAQKQAEANAAAAKEMISRLKEQLCYKQEVIEKLKMDSRKQNKRRKRKFSSSDDDDDSTVLSEQPIDLEEAPCSPLSQKMSFFETISCLSVTVHDNNIYYCTVNEGEIKGLKFEFQYDVDEYEYHYIPINSADFVKQTDALFGSIAFPDYMLPKFMMMILERTSTKLQELENSSTITITDN